MPLLSYLRFTLVLSLLIFLAWQKVQPSVWLQKAYGVWQIQNQTIPEYDPFASYAVQPPETEEEADSEHRFKALDTLTQKTLAWLTWGYENRVEDWKQMASRFAIFHYLIALVAYYSFIFACQKVSGSATLGVVFASTAMMVIVLCGYPQDAHLVGLLLFCLFLNGLGSDRLSWWALIFIPALWVLWVNADGGFWVGIALSFGLFLARIVELYQYFQNGGEEKTDLSRILRNLILTSVILLTSAYLTQFNPNGFRVLKLALNYPRGENIPDFPFWQPYDFSQPSANCWILMAFMAFLILLFLLSRCTLLPKYLILLVIFFVWALIHQKAFVWFVVIASWTVAYLSSGMRRPLQAIEPPPSAFGKIAYLILPVLALATSPSILALLNQASISNLVTADTPIEIGAVLKPNPENEFFPEWNDLLAHYPNQSFTGEILATPAQADFLMSVLEVPNHVVIHSHAYTYEKVTWDEYKALRDLGPSWWDLLERYQISLVILTPKTPLAKQLAIEKNWQVLRNDDHLFIAIRSKIPTTWR